MYLLESALIICSGRRSQDLQDAPCLYFVSIYIYVLLEGGVCADNFHPKLRHTMEPPTPSGNKSVL